MNRRAFFRAVGIGAAAAAIPIASKQQREWLSLLDAQSEINRRRSAWFDGVGAKLYAYEAGTTTPREIYEKNGIAYVMLRP